jgi:hypothetical protein
VGQFTATDHVFHQDNCADLDKDGKLNGRAVQPADFGRGTNAPTFVAAPSMGPLTNITVQPAAIALSNVLGQAGCSQKRDAVDTRLIEAVKSFGTRGQIIHSEAEIGGL